MEGREAALLAEAQAALEARAAAVGSHEAAIEARNVREAALLSENACVSWSRPLDLLGARLG